MNYFYLFGLGVFLSVSWIESRRDAYIPSDVRPVFEQTSPTDADKSNENE